MTTPKTSIKDPALKSNDYSSLASMENEIALLEEQETGQSKFRSIVSSVKAKCELNIDTKPSVYVLIVLLAIKSVGETISMAPSIELTKQKVLDAFPDSAEKGEQEFLRNQTVNGLITCIVGMVVCSKYGIASDHHGRVFVIKICAFFSCVRVLIDLYLYSTHFKYSFFLFNFWKGIGLLDGDIMAMNILSASYVSDIVSEKDRLMYLSLIGSAAAGISVVSPIVSSFVTATFGDYQVLYLTAFFYAVFFLGVSLLLSESSTERSRTLSKSEHESRIAKQKAYRETTQHTGSLWVRMYHFLRFDLILDVLHPLKFFYLPKTSTGSLIPRHNVLILLLVETFVLGTLIGASPVLVSYLLLSVGWGSAELNYYISLTSAAKLFSVVFIPKYFYKFLEQKCGFKQFSWSVDKIDLINMNILALGVGFSLLIPLCLVKGGLGLYLTGTVLSLIAFATPTIQNSVLKYCDVKKSGQVFTAFALLSQMFAIVIPPAFFWIYSKTLNSWPTFFLVIPLITCCISFVMLKFVKIVDDPKFLHLPEESEELLGEES
ncbi:hypothetical protein ACO0QE_002705 [Hanseniaspora vineae]